MPATAATLHPTALRPWQPLTDAEWDAIRPYLAPEAGPGRPTDRRKTLNAIFWIAASREPWRALPSHLGRADTANRALRRWARAGILERLLVAVSNHKLASQDATLRKLAWLICRAFRRMARILDEASVRLAQSLGLRDAWPAPVLRWPNPALTANTHRMFVATSAGVLAAPRYRPLLRAAMGVYQSCIGLMRIAAGNRRAWRLR